MRIPGLYVIEQTPNQDFRGEFSRVYCSSLFSENGLISDFKQINRSFSKSKGTLRGLHFQVNGFEEAKFVRVITGRIFDVAVDVREQSPFYLDWEAIELDSKNNLGFYLSPGFAHGILTLEDNSEIEYLVSQSFSPENERGLRWNDPKIGINWPTEPSLISRKDQQWELLNA